MLSATSVTRNGPISLTLFFTSAAHPSFSSKCPCAGLPVWPSSYCQQRDLIKWLKLDRTRPCIQTSLPTLVSEQQPHPTCRANTHCSPHLLFCISAAPFTSEPLYLIHTPYWMPTKYLITKSKCYFSHSFLEFSASPFFLLSCPTHLPAPILRDCDNAIQIPVRFYYIFCSLVIFFSY